MPHEKPYLRIGAWENTVQEAELNAELNVVWYGMVEVCEGAPVAVSGWVLTDRHDLAPCAANSLHRATMSELVM